jgi:hypothetical protein
MSFYGAAYMPGSVTYLLQQSLLDGTNETWRDILLLLFEKNMRSL